MAASITSALSWSPRPQDLLSKSRHYDWKLRAIKTTLYVAGGMKRASPELSEDKVCLGLPCCMRRGSGRVWEVWTRV